MGIYVFSAAVLALCVLAGLSLYRSHMFEKKLSNRLDLVVRASHTCASRMNTACEKLDTMQQERKGNFEYQRKVGEHQRVLLASLNRQIQNLDAHLANVPTLKQEVHSAVGPDRTVDSEPILETSVRRSIGNTIQNVSRVSKPDKGVVRLEEMFKRLETRKDIIQTPDETDRSAEYVEAAPMGDLEDEFRRAVNG